MPHVACVAYVTQVIFWIWTAARLLAEIKEIDSFSRDGLGAYISSNWNKLDLSLCGVVGAVCLARVSCDDHDPDAPDNCVSFTVWARNGYALAMIMVWVRSLQFVIELSEDVVRGVTVA